MMPSVRILETLYLVSVWQAFLEQDLRDVASFRWNSDFWRNRDPEFSTDVSPPTVSNFRCNAWTTLITMSENKSQFKHVPHGTNSPPLEATGSDKPMGASCIAGTQQAGHVSDAEQRRGEMGLLFFCFCFRFEYWIILLLFTLKV